MGEKNIYVVRGGEPPFLPTQTTARLASTLKNGFGKCSLFVYQPMDEKIKTWPLRFPTKENPNMEKALFDWPIVLHYDVKAKYRLNSRKFYCMKFILPERSLKQPKATRVCFRLINQSNRSISVGLLFLVSLRVFMSRSYENCLRKHLFLLALRR